MPKIYRNLDKKHPEAWSIGFRADGKERTQRVSYAICANLSVGGLTSTAFQECIAAPPGKGRRRVFAWFKYEHISFKERSIDLTGWERVFFNPKDRCDQYFHTSDGSRVAGASIALFTADGQMWISP